MNTQQRLTKWRDEGQIAYAARVSVRTVRRQWERMWQELDLPPVARGSLPPLQAERLINHLRQNRGNYRRRLSE